MSCANRLSILNLFSIYGRLARSDLIKYHKALSVVYAENGVNMGISRMFTAALDTCTRGHGLKFLLAAHGM